ncbi:hypothetical protein [Mucilaginibacter sp.]|uniref:hypothetical protein n=1 Tax=Mucilaginibacter sp. TaxID=1882438 RepID=UPI0035BBA75E
MKKLIGSLIILFSLAFVGILILRVWGIKMVSLPDLLRSGITLLLVGIIAFVLIIIYGSFFRNDDSAYNKNSGNRAHPKL